MKYILSIFCFFSLISCNYFEIKVKDYPVTKIDQKPLFISQSELISMPDSIKNKVRYPKNKSDNDCNVFEPDTEYGGFSPSYPMALLESNVIQSSLKISRGLIFVCYELLIKKDGKYLIISDESELKKIYAPVDTPEEAISFVCALTHSKPLYDFDLSIRNKYYEKVLNKTFVSKLDNDYVVRLYHFETFGCYPHSMFQISYLVKQNGDIKELSKVKIYDDIFNHDCVD